MRPAHTHPALSRRTSLGMMALFLWLLAWQPTYAQQARQLTLSLDEAIQIAVAQNYALRDARLNLTNAQAQVREGWGQLYPQVSVSAGYTRNLKAANPFSGSQAGGLFGSLGFLDWLAFNEDARTDDDASTAPLALSEFLDRQQEGRDAAGIVLETDSNPFLVPNQYTGTVSISQTVFDLRAFLGARAADQFLTARERSRIQRQEQLLIDEVQTKFYAALLALEQTDVVGLSVERTQATLREAAQRVSQGVAPKFERLTAEVNLVNLETDYLQARNQAALTLDDLKLTLGIPIDQPLQLRGDLEAEDRTMLMTVSSDAAIETAFDNRPDLEDIRLSLELQKVQTRVARASYYPTLSAVANFSYIGNVPSNRTVVLSDPDDPFQFSSRENNYFSGSYWNPAVSVGFQFTWNLFTGFQTRSQIQQQQIALDKIALQQEQTLQTVKLEVDNAIRNLRTAEQRIASQERNVANAELNYQYAQTRLREGVASPLEERDASQLLDQSRLNYLQAIHDFLVARSAFNTAVGAPLGATDNVQLTTR